MRNKDKKIKIIKYGALAAFILCAIVLCVESLLPGSVSSKHSNNFGDLIDIPVDKVVSPKTLRLKSMGGELNEDVYVGQSLSLLPEFTPKNTTFKHVKWSVSDDSLAEVDDNDIVSFLKAGTVIVTATSEYDDEISASFEFHIIEMKSDGIFIDAPSAMDVGQTVALTATVTPASASDKSYFFETDSDCVKLEGQALTALSAGVASVWAYTVDGATTAMTTIEIKEVPAQSLRFIKDGAPVSDIALTVGESASFSVSLLPENVTHSDLSWHSDIDLYFSSDDEFSVTPYSSGEFNVTVENAELSATLRITVTGEALPDNVTEIVAEPLTLQVGQAASVKVRMFFSGAPAWKTPTFASSSDVVTIDELGLIRAEKVGVANVEIAVGELRSYASVTVTEADIELSIVRPASAPQIDKEYPLFCTHMPKIDASVDVVWSVSDEDIASIKDGVCTFKKAGSVTVTARSGKAVTTMDLTAHNVLVALGLKAHGFDSFEKVEPDKWTASLKLNTGARISLIFGEGVTYRDYELASSDPDILAVTDNIATAVKLGSATLTVTYADDLAETKYIYSVDVEITEQMLSDVTQNWGKTIRKGIGHFGAFLLTGIFASLTFALFIRRKYLAIPPTLISGFALAGLTELLQMITPGRGPAFADVLLDFQGFCFAAVPILLGFLIAYIVRKNRNKNHNK